MEKMPILNEMNTTITTMKGQKSISSLKGRLILVSTILDIFYIKVGGGRFIRGSTYTRLRTVSLVLYDIQLKI